MATWKQLEAALDAWRRVRRFDEACDLMARAIDGKYVWAPPTFIPTSDEELEELGNGFLEEDSIAEAGALASINHLGLLTIDSQPGSIEKGISQRTGKKYVIRQRAYIIGIIEKKRASYLLDEMEALGFRGILGGNFKDCPVMTEQNGEPFTTGCTQTIRQMTDSLQQIDDGHLMSYTLLEYMRRNCQTIMVYDPKFGRRGLAAHLAMALRNL